MKYVNACLLVPILWLAIIDAQSLRRERDLARTAAEALARESAEAWRLVHRLRATLAAHETLDPETTKPFLDR